MVGGYKDVYIGTEAGGVEGGGMGTGALEVAPLRTSAPDQ